MNILFISYFRQKKLFRTGSGRFRKSDPDPVKNRPDPQHWVIESENVPKFLVVKLRWSSIESYCLIALFDGTFYVELGWLRDTKFR
jgi:hypothetical protein